MLRQTAEEDRTAWLMSSLVPLSQEVLQTQRAVSNAGRGPSAAR